MFCQHLHPRGSQQVQAVAEAQLWGAGACAVYCGPTAARCGDCEAARKCAEEKGAGACCRPAIEFGEKIRGGEGGRGANACVKPSISQESFSLVCLTYASPY